MTDKFKMQFAELQTYMDMPLDLRNDFIEFMLIDWDDDVLLDFEALIEAVFQDIKESTLVHSGVSLGSLESQSQYIDFDNLDEDMQDIVDIFYEYKDQFKSELRQNYPECIL